VSGDLFDDMSRPFQVPIPPPVPDFADGAVAELRHGADGTVIADIRIPGPDPALRHGGPDAGWYRRTMGGWRRVSDTEAARERYEDMRHFMHDPDEDDHGPQQAEA